MALGKELNVFLSDYDMYHSSLNENILQLNMKFLNDNSVIFSLSELKQDIIVKKSEYIFNFDFDFKSRIFPKIFLYFISSNSSVNIEKEKDNLLCLSNKDKKEKFFIENCPESFIKILESLYKDVSILNSITDRSIDIKDEKNDKISRYVSCNLALFYAKYRTEFLDNDGSCNFFDIKNYKNFLNKEKRDNKTENKKFVVLDVARYAYSIGINNGNVWDQIREQYNEDNVIEDICVTFKNRDYDSDSIFNKALMCAEYEENNKNYIMNNIILVNEALDAAKEDVLFYSNGFLEYWDRKKRFYKLVENDELVKICNDFLNSNRLILHNDAVDNIKKTNNSKENLVTKLKNIKKENLNNFSNIINNPVILKTEQIRFRDEEHDKLAIGGQEQAKQLIDALNEREKIKRDAEEFAKIILKEQRERREIIKMAEEQAVKIMKLEKENVMLKKLAEENAKYIFENNKKYNEELKLREELDESPIKSSDIDKINYLLNALSNVKELDFSVNHPTTMQTINLLEQKIFTYLLTHKNIIDSSINKDNDSSIDENTDFNETKTPTELLAIIRNVYSTSQLYVKDGRHTVVNITYDDNKYRVVIYSVKDDNDDILTDVLFDSYYFTSEVIKEICDIYLNDAIIVASKTDNIPNGYGDYLVIDNHDNAMKFMGCPVEIIEIAKTYL